MIDNKVINEIEDRLIKRYESGALISEVDFLTGAMAGILAYSGFEGDDIGGMFPAAWILFPMSSRSVVPLVLRGMGRKADALAADKSIFVKHHEIQNAHRMLSILRSVANRDKGSYYYDLVSDVREELEDMGLGWASGDRIEDNYIPLSDHESD